MAPTNSFIPREVLNTHQSRIHRAPSHCANCCFYVASRPALVSLRVGGPAIIPLPICPMLSQLTSKVLGSKSHWLYKLMEFSPSSFQGQILWGFVFPMWAPCSFLFSAPTIPSFLQRAPNCIFYSS